MRRFATILAATVLFVPLALQDPERPPRPVSQVPEVGKPAPAFRLNDHRGRATDIGGAAEHWTVIAFFPKAATPGCTREVCSLRDSAGDFDRLGVKVYGISVDDVQALAAFAADQELAYGLLSDPDGSAARKYGVLSPDRPFARRVTFVIDEKGGLRAVDDKVNVGEHGAQLTRLIDELRAK